MHILENVEPELTKRLRKLAPAQYREVLKSACRFVSSKITLDPELAALTALCVSDQPLTEEQRQSLESYAEAAGERYFEMQESGAAEGEWVPWFQKARFATALTNVWEEGEWDDVADGLYELTVIFDDSSVVEFIKRSLPEVQA